MTQSQIAALVGAEPVGQILPVPSANTESLAIDKQTQFQLGIMAVTEGTTRKDYHMQDPIYPYTYSHKFPIFGALSGTATLSYENNLFPAAFLGIILDGEQRKLLYATSSEPMDPRNPLEGTSIIHNVSTVSIDDVLGFRELVPKQ